MQALHWEIPDLKLRRTCCLDSSLVSANLTRTPCRTGENDTDGQVYIVSLTWRRAAPKIQSRELSIPSNMDKWQSMNAVVTEEHRATSEINLGDQNLARMYSFDLETNELKSSKASSLDSTHPRLF